MNPSFLKLHYFLNNLPTCFNFCSSLKELGFSTIFPVTPAYIPKGSEARVLAEERLPDSFFRTPLLSCGALFVQEEGEMFDAGCKDLANALLVELCGITSTKLSGKTPI